MAKIEQHFIVKNLNCPICFGYVEVVVKTGGFTPGLVYTRCEEHRCEKEYTEKQKISLLVRAMRKIEP